jgi:RND family efflux transporter MFP subunit
MRGDDRQAASRSGDAGGREHVGPRRADGDLLKELRIDPSERDGAATRPRRAWIVGGAVAVLVGLALVGGRALFGKAVEVRTATAAAPAAGRAAEVLQATGYVTARRKATVSAQITGRLTEVLIEEGDRVEEGQVLARLDDTDAHAALALAEAQLASARAQVGQFEARLAQARRDLSRLEDLFARKLVPAQEVETARTLVATTASELAAQRAQVEVAEAQVRAARVALDYTYVRAPFGGVITEKTAQPGEIVSPMSAGGGFTRTGIGTIVDMRSLEIEVDVNEAYIGRVHAGQPAHAVLDAYPSWEIPARVIAIVPTADRSKATVKVRVAIESDDPRTLPDMGVRVSFLDETPAGEADARRGVLVPATAVVERDDGRSVFVVRDGTAHRVPVTAGQTYGDLRAIEEGLAEGDRVVLDPPAELADGARVRIAERR